MKLPVALQLYTVRDETIKDFVGTLEKVSAIGYQGVEFAGFGEVPADEMKKVLKRLGLKAVGSHTPKELLFNELDKVIEYNLEIGNTYVICPYDSYETQDEWYTAIDRYRVIAEKLRENGLQYCYHNHAHEFVKYGNEYLLDIMYKMIDDSLLKAEIDTYWVYYAGVDPVGYVLKYSGRMPLVHIKDMEKQTRDYTEVGEGRMDIGSIVKASAQAGAEWLIIEQDSCKMPSLESAKLSFDNLKKILKRSDDI
jgi:sugar phosphate isomerase/epimerase